MSPLTSPASGSSPKPDWPAFLTTLSEDPHRRGREFEQACKRYLLGDPQYKSLLKRVWLWNDWPPRWGADAGIDLVAEARDGGLWAVQAKAYDPNYSITKRDVDTFLSESGRSEFSYRLVIATTNRIGRTADRTLQQQEKGCGKILLSDMRRSEAYWSAALRLRGAPGAKQKKPRPHQRQAVNEVVKGFRQADRGQLVMACGAGKTLVGLWVADILQGESASGLLT